MCSLLMPSFLLLIPRLCPDMMSPGRGSSRRTAETDLLDEVSRALVETSGFPEIGLFLSGNHPNRLVGGLVAIFYFPIYWE